MTDSHIYVLPKYANSSNLKNVRTQTQDEYRITYHHEGSTLTLSETNSLIEDAYSLNLESSQYLVEGTTETAEMMIQHHPQGHPLRHLQFKIRAKKTVRIFLDLLDAQSYEKCIEGFIHICRECLVNEASRIGIQENLSKYYFNDTVDGLLSARTYLLEQIHMAYGRGQVTADDKAINAAELEQLRAEQPLIPFFDWH